MTIDIPSDQIDKPAAWDKAYQDGTHPWDLDGPTPEFMRLVRENQFAAEGARVLIPGAGYGHNAVALAKLAYQVTAVEFAPVAANHILAAARKENVHVNVLRRDFFELAHDGAFQENFDCILEYTFYCAIPPKRRREYAENAARLLRKQGSFIGLFFPLEDREGGPPFAVHIDDVKKSFGDWFELSFQDPVKSVKPRKGREVLGIFTKK